MSFEGTRALLPLELHADGLVQFDQALHQLGIPSQLTISAADLITDDYFATRELIHCLSLLEKLEVTVVDVSEVHQAPIQQIVYMALTQDGACFAFELHSDATATLTAYDRAQHPISQATDTWTVLQQRFDLSSQMICLRTQPNARTPLEYHTPFVWPHFWQHQHVVWQILGVAVVLALLGLAPPLGFQAFADKILPNDAHQSLLVVVVLLLLAAGANSILQCFHDMLESTLFARYQNGLARTVFQRLLLMPMDFLDERSTGDLTKLFEQVQEVANFLVRQLLAAVVATLSLLVVLPLLVSYSPRLSIVVISLGVLMAVSVALGLKALRIRIQEAYQFDALFQSRLIEAFKGMRTVKALCLEAHFQQQLQRAHSHQLYGNFNVARLTHGMGAWVHFQSQLITIAVIFFGAQAVFAQQMTIGQLIAFNMLANNLVQPLLSLVMTAQGWEHFRLAHKKLHELTPTLKNEPLGLQPQGAIEFKHLWFHYPKTPDEPVLKDIELRIEPGETIGIVGASGSGKSTLAQLLLGFYQPTRGQITLGGHDLRLIPTSELRGRIAWVSQETFLFNTSVLNNVHLGRLGANFESVQTALDRSESTPFVTQLNAGVMTVLSEEGHNLSGGQRQRLALARALLREADILIFDEATSALDAATEHSLLQSIRQACVGRTAIMIAHRLQTLLHCDRIAVMEHGHLTGLDTHTRLLENHSHYQTLWQAMEHNDVA